ncbi:hypothetical protein [Marinifilum fragile]|uniref:hypothetical protein n=1 Tax=Marinifilum fragile TaxID=570161 RepID=UPI0006D19738|nr:hypothetical protein [Marinifilum fragile]
MGKKKSNKEFSVKNRVKLAFILLAIFSPIFVFIHFNHKKNKELLQNDSFKTIAFIEKLRPNQRKGITTSKDVIYFKYRHNDTVFHGIHQEMVGTISGLKMKIGDAHELIVARSNSSVYRLNLDSKLDTVFNNSTVKCHSYKSERHRDIIK